jgi:hypothetical protein
VAAEGVSILVQGAADAAAALVSEARRVSAQQTLRARWPLALCELSEKDSANIFHHE